MLKVASMILSWGIIPPNPLQLGKETYMMSQSWGADYFYVKWMVWVWCVLSLLFSLDEAEYILRNMIQSCTLQVEMWVPALRHRSSPFSTWPWERSKLCTVPQTAGCVRTIYSAAVLFGCGGAMLTRTRPFWKTAPSIWWTLYASKGAVVSSVVCPFLRVSVSDSLLVCAVGQSFIVVLVWRKDE